jgi:hypothetical protein
MEGSEMRHINKAFLGAILMAGTALVGASAPARAQSFSIQGYVGNDPYYGSEPSYDPYYDQGYQDPSYDPNYYDPNYSDPNYGYDQQYYGDSYGYGDSYDYGYDYAYDYSDPYYYYTPTYTPLYDPFYDPYCDYYSPPWGFPLDYCRYQLWRQPVYFGGLWYSGPIYYRVVSGVNWFWLNGRWCRDEWRGARPSYIDWSRNKRWDGPRHNWRDEYRRGTWAGRNTWVGRNYRDNIQEARRNVLDRARDRNFRQEFVRNIRQRNDGVAGARGRDFNRPGFTNDARGRNNNGFDRRALRDGGSNLVRPNDRRPDVRGNPRVERQLNDRRPNVAIPNQRFDNNRALRNQDRAPRSFAAPNQGPRVGGNDRRLERNFAPPSSGPRVDNRAQQRSFAAPADRGPRVDRGPQQRSFAAPQRAPRVESRAPRIENRSFGGGNRGALSAPRSAPRVAAPSGGPRVQARGGGSPRAFSSGGGGSRGALSAPRSAPRVAAPGGGQRVQARGGGGGGSPRAFSGGGGGSNRSVSNGNRGGGGAAVRGGGGGNRGNRGRDR